MGKKKHPNAVFIQVLGSSGAGKSTLMNTLVAGPDAVDEDDFVEIFKTDVVECTVESQFYDVTDKLKTNKKVFLVDQPGIGGQKVSAQGYMQKFSPANYDLTILATASRLMENEVHLIKHLENFKRDYVLVRTKVDAEFGGKIMNHDEIVCLIESLKKKFQGEISQLKPNKVFFTGKPIDFKDAGTKINFNDEYISIIAEIKKYAS